MFDIERETGRQLARCPELSRGGNRRSVAPTKHGDEYEAEKAHKPARRKYQRQ